MSVPVLGRSHKKSQSWKHNIVVGLIISSISMPSECSLASAFMSHQKSTVRVPITAIRLSTMPMPPPPTTAHSNALYNLISTNRERNESKEKVSAIPLAGIHDALSAKIFAMRGAPALFLSGFGVSASLLGTPDAGITNQVEMEQITRNVHAAIEGRSPPLIVDGDTGYGGPGNMLRTITTLSKAGAAAITIEDQDFPKKCAIAAGDKIRIVDRDNAVQRVKGALGARDFAGVNAGCWIVARTDCRLAYGFEEVIERCLRFEELGAEIVYAENLQSVDEYVKLREKLDPSTITMVAQVQEVKTISGERTKDGKPLLNTKHIGELGYDLALFGVTPLQCVIGTLLSTADQFYANNGLIYSEPETEHLIMSNFGTVKQVVGFEELLEFERKYPCC